MTCGFHGMEDFNINPNKYGIDFDGPRLYENNDNIIVVDEPRNILNQQQLMLLRSRVDPLENDVEEIE
ncbi:hypothetical protein C1645_832608 [Glomus cerebriforme]|uniref:Uncharacterized protein n=1 Tax=Glomus cerebriforme TaxID=658196 RepID=A0A397SF95_9GLOM|nr:hypothetical protein C1645_832608 [Glomus cerebriforme]